MIALVFSFLLCPKSSVGTILEGNTTIFAGLIQGSSNGVGTVAKFDHPLEVRLSPTGLFALVADRNNHLIRQIITSTASVTILAGYAGSTGSTNGVGTNSKFSFPFGVSISSDGAYALVAGHFNFLLRHIVISTASVTTLAGSAGSAGSTNGIGTNTKFNYPISIPISPSGIFALVADFSNYLVRHIVITTASVTTLAGVSGSSGSKDGIGTNAKFGAPGGITFSLDGSYALITDFTYHTIRRITISTASVSTLAGVSGSSGSTNGVGSNAKFNNPYSIDLSGDGLYALFSDHMNHLIRRLTISTSSVTTIAGASAGSTNGVGTNARFYNPVGVSIAPDGVYALIGDNGNNLIRRIELSPSPSSSPTISPTFFTNSLPTFLPTTVSPTFSPNLPILELTSVPSALPTFAHSPTSFPSFPDNQTFFATSSPAFSDSFFPSPTISPTLSPDTWPNISSLEFTPSRNTLTISALLSGPGFLLCAADELKKNQNYSLSSIEKLFLNQIPVLASSLPSPDAMSATYVLTGLVPSTLQCVLLDPCSHFLAQTPESGPELRAGGVDCLLSPVGGEIEPIAVQQRL
jgi:hypothetical protein